VCGFWYCEFRLAKRLGICQDIFAKLLCIGYIADMTHDQIIKKYGTPTSAKNALGVTLQTLRNWKANGIPYQRQVYIQFQTGGQFKAGKK